MAAALPYGQSNEAQYVVPATGKQVSILHVVTGCRIHWNLNDLVRVKPVVHLSVVKPVLKQQSNSCIHFHSKICIIVL